MKIIGVDIDDTITMTSKGIKDFLDKNPHKVKNQENVIKNISNILNVNMKSDDIALFLNSFFADIVKTVEAREDSVSVLNKLREEGNKIILITARSDSYFPKSAEISTSNYLEEFQIPYDKLVTNAPNKVKECLDNNVSIMIDDSISVCESLKDTNVTPLLFTTERNKHINTDIRRVSNWLELYEIIK